MRPSRVFNNLARKWYLNCSRSPASVEFRLWVRFEFESVLGFWVPGAIRAIGSKCAEGMKSTGRLHRKSTTENEHETQSRAWNQKQKKKKKWCGAACWSGGGECNREREWKERERQKGRERGQQQPLRYKYKFHDGQAGVVHAFTASSFYASLIRCACVSWFFFIWRTQSTHTHKHTQAVEHSKQQQRK